MTNSRSLTVGIVGTGQIAAIHAGHLATFPNVKVTAVASNDMRRAQAFAKVHAIPTAVAPYENIFLVGLDAVIICSTASSHPMLIKAAAMRGMHIFCEKPIGNHLGEIESALDLVRQTGVLLQVGFNRPFDPYFAALKEKILSNETGEVEQINIVSRDPHAPSPENLTMQFALISETMIHDLHMAYHLCGQIESVHVSGGLVTGLLSRPDQIDTATALLRFTTGAVGSIQNSWRSKWGYDQRVELHARKGTFFVHNLGAVVPEKGIPAPIPGFFKERYAQSYQLELEAFVQSVRDGTKVLVTGDDGRYAVALVVAAKKSFLQGQKMLVADFLRKETMRPVA